jgi:hypothetical protein
LEFLEQLHIHFQKEVLIHVIEQTQSFLQFLENVLGTHRIIQINHPFKVPFPNEFANLFLRIAIQIRNLCLSQKNIELNHPEFLVLLGLLINNLYNWVFLQNGVHFDRVLQTAELAAVADHEEGGVEILLVLAQADHDQLVVPDVLQEQRGQFHFQVF